jgi:hypothetical protein
MFAQTSTQVSGGASAALVVIYVVVIFVLVVIPMWVIFQKAGVEPWKSIIPIYNTYMLLKIVGRPGWWLLLLLIPFVNFITLIIVYNDLSKSFGKGGWFTVGLIFLSWIFLMILAFGSATYLGPAGPEALASGPGAATPAMPPPPA